MPTLRMEEIKKLISDRLRDELQAQGITLIDKPGGITIWNRD
jgi:cysteinyl-tRNA synthetase